MDIIFNKKKLTKLNDLQDRKIKRQKTNSNKMQSNFSLDGLGKKIPISSIRRNKQLHFLIKTKNSFGVSNKCNYPKQRLATKGYLKAIKENKIFFRNNSLDGFSNSKKNYPSNCNYQLEEVGFNETICKNSFLNREFSVYNNLESTKKEFNLLYSIKLLKFSLVGAMVLGMVVMGFIYHNLGDNVLAKIENNDVLEEGKDNLYFSQEENFYSRGQVTDDQKKELEKRIREMVAGQPIENMIPYILEQDYQVAAYLVAIAKKESQWGSRVPVLNGKDCYNYWGYRENRDLMGSEGHTCFNSRKDAVETVGKRLDDLIYKQNKKTVRDLIVWKCGSSCDGHSQEGVDSWINTVGTYYNELVK